MYFLLGKYVVMGAKKAGNAVPKKRGRRKKRREANLIDISRILLQESE